MKGNCRSSWRSCAIWRLALSAVGPTLKDRRAGLVCVARVKPSSKPTAVYCVTVSCRSCRGWKKSRNSASRGGGRVRKPIFLPCRWWAIPTPENQRSLTRSLPPRSMPRTSCSPPWTRRCAALTSLTSAKRCWPIPSALFATCRTIW